MGQLNVQNQTITIEPVHSNTTINRSTFVKDIIKSIRYMENNDVKDMIVKINPKDLGEVYIKVTSTADGIMKASISANNRETFNILNANIHNLNNNLNDSQVKINHIDINMYNSNTTLFNSNSDRNENSQSNLNHNNNVSHMDYEDVNVTSEDIVYDDNKLNILI